MGNYKQIICREPHRLVFYAHIDCHMFLFVHKFHESFNSFSKMQIVLPYINSIKDHYNLFKKNNTPQVWSNMHVPQVNGIN